MANRTWIGGDSGNETDFNTAANWTGSTVPITNDNVYFPSTKAYNLAAYDASAIDLSELIVERGSNIQIGSLSASGIPSYFQIGMAGSGAKLLEYNGTGASYFDVDDAAEIKIASAASGSTFTYGLVFVGTGNTATNIVASDIQPGTNKIGLAPFGGGTYQSDTIKIAAHEVHMGAGCQTTAAAAVPVTITGGTVFSECALGASSMTGGSLTVKKGAVTSLAIKDSRCLYEGTGTVTTLTIDANGVFDLRAGAGSVTITNAIQMSAGAVFYDPAGRSGNVAFVLNNCTLNQVTIVTPLDKTITLS